MINELIKPIVQEMKKDLLALFIGPFFSVANGFRDLHQCFQRLIEDFFSNKEDMDKWLKDGDFHRIAEGYNRSSPGKEQPIENKLSRDFRGIRMPEPLYRQVASLPVRAIVSSCLDSIMDGLVNCPSRCLTVEDQVAEALNDLRAHKRHLAYALGQAAAPETVALTFTRFSESAKRPAWVDYFLTLFRKYTPVFVGFEPSDFFLRKLVNFAEENRLSTSGWYFFHHLDKESVSAPSVFITVPAREFLSLDNKEVKFIGDQDTARFAIQEFLGLLLEKSIGLRLEVFTGFERADKPWLELTDRIIEDEPQRQPEEFFRGKEIFWNEIQSGLDVPRNISLEVKEFLREQKLSVGILMAPSGMGKTTVAKRIAYDLWKTERFMVFWAKDTNNISGDLKEKLLLSRNRDVLLVVDRAENLTDLPRRLHQWRTSNCQRLRILLVGRTHEMLKGVLPMSWLRSQRECREFKLGWITRTEAEGFLDRLSKHRIITTTDHRAEYHLDRLLNEAKGDLLAGLLMLIEGKDLEAIVTDVCNKVISWPNGLFLLQAYALVALIETTGAKCDKNLFISTLDSYIQEDVFRRLFHRLPGELALESRGEYVETRHKKIAEIVCRHLISDSGPYFNEVDIFSNILTQANKIGTKSNIKLNTIIPLYFKKFGAIDTARKLFQIAVKASPGDTPAWQAWALMEKEEGNIPRARELFESATKADPKHAPSWQAWAIMEKEERNIPRARELFESATKADSKDAPSWQAWALMEKEQGNIPRARELFQRATEADPKHVPSWRAWVQMEEELGQTQYSKELKETARLYGVDLSDSRDGDKTITGRASAKVKRVPKKAPESEHWPFTPEYISHHLTFGQYRSICYLLSGLSHRLGAPVVLVEFPGGVPSPIYPVSRRFNYPAPCQKLFKKELLGEDHLCDTDIRKRALWLFKKYQSGFISMDEPVIRSCWAGIRSLHYPLLIEGKLMGLFIIGKFPPKAIDAEKVKNEWAKALEDTYFRRPEEKEQLPSPEIVARAFADMCSPDSVKTSFQDDQELLYHFETTTLRGLGRVEESIVAMHRQRRALLENDFYAGLHSELNLSLKRDIPLFMLKKNLTGGLEKLRKFIGAKYTGLFMGFKPEDRYLQLIVMVGGGRLGDIPPHVYIDKLGAGLPPEILSESAWIYQNRRQDFLEHGVKGGDRAHLVDVFLAVPFSHLGRMGILYLGPLKKPMADHDLDTLRSLCFRFCLELAGTYFAKLHQYEVDRNLLGLSLYVHRLRHGAHENLNGVGLLEALLEKPAQLDAQVHKMCLKQLKELKMYFKEFKDAIAQGLKSATLMAIEHTAPDGGKWSRTNSIEDWTWLGVLLENVASKHNPLAVAKGMSLKVNDGVPASAAVAIDTQLLYEALSCLVDNAIKYGKNGSPITIDWSEVPAGMVRVTVNNHGRRLTEQMRQRMFDKGATFGGLSESFGWGLYLVKEVARKFGGEAGHEFTELNPSEEEFQAHTFWMKLRLYKPEDMK